jgi:uncharacterized protein (DUF362 family)
MAFNKEGLIYIEKQEVHDYPEAPYHPQTVYSELARLDHVIETDSENKIYAMVRSVLQNLGFDKENFGTESWRPFKDLIKPGQHVVLKPNFVRGDHPLGQDGVVSMITHASLMRPLVDYLFLSTGGECKITICDVPLQSSSWDQIITRSGTLDLVNFYKGWGIGIELLDLRKEISYLNEQQVIYQRDFEDRDPLGYSIVDLGRKSALVPVSKYYKRFMITDYDKGTVSRHHDKEKNEYFIANTVLDADLFINLPKLKTHRKAGLTCAGKNLIGINGDKRWIAHHREGSVWSGGDEFPKYVLRQWVGWHLEAFLKRHPGWGVWAVSRLRLARKKTTRLLGRMKLWVTRAELFPEASGGEGNDTLWRTISDLTWIILYGDKKGTLKESPQRNYFCLVDSIVAGEGEGPMEQLPKKAGILIGGFHSLAIDFAAARVMGFDYLKIPAIHNLFGNEAINYSGLSPENIEIRSNVDSSKINLRFEPTIGWKGHIEA